MLPDDRQLSFFGSAPAADCVPEELEYIIVLPAHDAMEGISLPQAVHAIDPDWQMAGV